MSFVPRNLSQPELPPLPLEWVARVSRRAIRQRRCERCSTERRDGQNSLAALHPTLVREGDIARNGARDVPTGSRTTYAKAVGWI